MEWGCPFQNARLVLPLENITSVSSSVEKYRFAPCAKVDQPAHADRQAGPLDCGFCNILEALLANRIAGVLITWNSPSNSNLGSRFDDVHAVVVNQYALSHQVNERPLRLCA